MMGRNFNFNSVVYDEMMHDETKRAQKLATPKKKAQDKMAKVREAKGKTKGGSKGKK
jgi:hypothetical protein